jgi:hypothetical protein
MYENAHTPPSLKRGGKRKKDQDKGSGKKPGKKKGHNAQPCWLWHRWIALGDPLKV